MQLEYYIVDAFADKRFTGNQAGVCLLAEWPEDRLMQQIAGENNLSETAFAVRRERHWDLRWFTPLTEIDLCGHATLATAFIITSFVEPDAMLIRFQTMSGTLTVERNGALFEMDFPARIPEKLQPTPQMEAAIAAPILEAYLERDLMVVVDSEKRVRELIPDLALVERLPNGLGLTVTAKGETADFVSRFFAPKLGVSEDPVTGSSHAALIPYWSERLGKRTMIARQLSRRGGTVHCEHCGDRVKIAGQAVLYMRGFIYLEDV